MPCLALLSCRCFQDKEHLEAGDKILLPSSALDALARQQVEYPMLFELSNPSQVSFVSSAPWAAALVVEFFFFRPPASFYNRVLVAL